MQGILLAFIPLIIFAILDSLTTLNIALIATIIATIIEIIYTLYAFGSLDAISIFSIILVVILTGLSYKKQNRQFIKLKPGLLKFCLGAYLSIAYVFGHPLLLEMVQKYPQLIPAAQQQFYETVYGKHVLTQLSIGLGIAFVIYGIIVAWAGLKLTNFWWTSINIIGFFLSILIPTYLILF